MRVSKATSESSPGAVARSSPLSALRADPERRRGAEEQVRRLSAHGTEYVYLQLVSLDGRISGKGMPLDQLVSKAEHGIQLHLGALTDLRLDQRGQLLAFGAEDTEFVAVPDPGSCVPLPWDRRVARCLCDLYTLDGQPLDCDPRGFLRQLVPQLEAQTGLQFRIGIEPEMMFLRRDPGGQLAGPTEGYAYHIHQMEVLRPVILDLVDAARQMGLEMIQGAHEDAPGQVELNFMAAGPLQTADNLMAYRQVARAIGERHGFIPTFMPKPFADRPANGHHHHVSATDAGGHDAFRGPGPAGLSAAGLHFTGGLLAHANALTAICAPTVNSYKRFWHLGQWAPINRSWGIQNRTALVRVVEPGRIEFRLPDASSNPYLTIAALLVAGCDGITRELDPGPPLADSAYDHVVRGDGQSHIPLTLHDALDALAADPAIREALPGRLLEAYTALRRDEWERYCAQVSEWERERYLTYWP